MKKRLLFALTGLAVGAASLLGGATAAFASAPTVGYDTNGDGWTETWFVDSNGDGLYEFAVFDFNLDGYRDGIAVDMNENGIWEMFFLDPNENGYTELFAIDDNDDGYIDRALRDTNENGVEDSNESYIQTEAIVGGTPTYGVGPGSALLGLAARTGVAAWPSYDWDGDGYYDY
jgi:hypothetical protein